MPEELSAFPDFPSSTAENAGSHGCVRWMARHHRRGRSPLGESHDLSRSGDAGVQAAMEQAAPVRMFSHQDPVASPCENHEKEPALASAPAQRKRTESISSAGKPRPRISDGRSPVRGGLASTGFHDSAVFHSVGQFAVCGSGSRGGRPARISWVLMDTVTAFSNRSMM